MKRCARSTSLIVASAAITASLAAYTHTTVGGTNINPGHELAMRVCSGRSEATLTNHGPGPVLLTLDAEGVAFDERAQVAPGTRAIRLHGWTDLTVSNPAGQDAQPVSFTLVVKDPCKFDGGFRPTPATTQPAE